MMNPSLRDTVLTDEPARSVSPDEAGAESPGLPWWAFGLANLAVIFTLSLGSWWLLADPRWSVFDTYPQPYSAVLFWTIIATVWVGFTFEWLGPTSFPQPWRGLTGILLAFSLGLGITLVLAHGWGAVDPSFASSRADGAGYTTGQLFVLFAFFFYVVSAVNANHWPWSAKTSQPWTGLGELTLVLVPTAVVYCVVALPGLAEWATPNSALLSVPTLIGWFYSLVVAAVITGLIAENRPWNLTKQPGAVAAAAVVGNLALGTGLYFVLLAVAKLLMGSANVAEVGTSATLYAAQIGVCWNFWMIAWANIFGNKPTNYRTGVNISLRLAATFALGVITFLVYYFSFAQHVLHEPLVPGTTLSGDALGFIDWLVLWMLWYVLFLGSYGLPRPRGETVESGEQPVRDV